MSASTDLDLLVVGAGPAGLATAIEACLRGLRVAVFDRRRPPIDKPCGEGLMPDGLDRLKAMGVEIGWESLSRFDGIRYIDRGLELEGSFPGVCGAGVRRLHLHQAMLKRASALGAEIYRARVAVVDPHRGTLEAYHDESRVVTYQARCIAVADGLRSPIRKALGLDKNPKDSTSKGMRFGVRRHFALEPWTRKVEVYWGHRAEAYVTPVGPKEVGIAMLWGERKASFRDLMMEFPEIHRRVRGSEPLSKAQGIGPLRQRARAFYLEKVALIGDASGYVDAITGEGLSIAFHQAQALAEAVTKGDLGEYQRRCRSIVRQPNGMTELLLWLERRPGLRRRAFTAMARDPRIFDTFLAVHCRSAPTRSLLEVAPRLAWGVLRS